MNIILCLDTKNGMSFNDRRQSKDREVRRDMLSFTRSHRLWMNEYSRKQFDNYASYPQIAVDENFPAAASDEDYCFLESPKYLINKYLLQEIIIYRWDKEYPADTYFKFDFTGWILVETKVFAGFSHVQIIREVWKNAKST